jgi:hypothetical protein
MQTHADFLRQERTESRLSWLTLAAIIAFCVIAFVG